MLRTTILSRLAAIEAKLDALLEMNTPAGRHQAAIESEEFTKAIEESKRKIWDEYRERIKAK